MYEWSACVFARLCVRVCVASVVLLCLCVVFVCMCPCLCFVSQHFFLLVSAFACGDFRVFVGSRPSYDQRTSARL